MEKYYQWWHSGDNDVTAIVCDNGEEEKNGREVGGEGEVVELMLWNDLETKN
jgi:hypothetical protein